MNRRRTEKLGALFENDGREPREREDLFRLFDLVADLPPPPDSGRFFPRFDRLKERFLQTLDDRNWENVEEAFLELYCHLHMHEAPYTREERRRVSETGGYWCHAGGLSPLLKAGPWIDPGTVLADLGAGNGLQGLLFQKLHPHARTVQVEISSRMVAIGRDLQAWLDIAEEKVEWVVDDVCNVSIRGFDFIYLYRPVRPEGEGLRFYERFTAELSGSGRGAVIFSIADCLAPFLPPGYEAFYSDGHLTCYRRSSQPT